MQHEGQMIREAAQEAPAEADELLSPDGRRGIDVHLPPQCRQQPAQRTPPAMVRANSCTPTLDAA